MRNMIAREAPKISRTLSGLTENNFGCGGLKLGGGENSVDVAENPKFGSSLVLTEVELRGVLGNSADDLIETSLFGCLRLQNDRKIGDGEKFRTPAIRFRREGLKSVEQRKKGTVVGVRLRSRGYMALFFFSLHASGQKCDR
ncbi:hypothetical protein U1Q18_014176 [Sarracenia purpurea var. burkii]